MDLPIVRSTRPETTNPAETTELDSSHVPMLSQPDRVDLISASRANLPSPLERFRAGEPSDP